MASNRNPPNTTGLWTQSNGLTPLAPLAPVPLLPYPQLNVPLTGSLPTQTAPAPAPEEELTSDLHFPVRLHYMLSDITKEGVLTKIVSWQPHGRCFVVHNKKEFVEKILCNWFRQSKWPSFQRQLNMYGFKRLTQGPDKNGYYHDLFLQDQPKLAQRIQRQKLKGTGHRRAAQPDQEPNFYAMPSIRPALTQYHPLPGTCPSAPAPASITLRSSLASHILSSPEFQPRAIAVRTTASVEQKRPTDIASIFTNRSHATMSEEDEKDLEALAQLASWF